MSQNTVANILKKHGVEPAPTRNQGTPWADFIKSHLAVMAATDFFTVEVLTLKGLVTYYVRFFIEIGSGRVHPAVIRQNPDEASMMHVARSVTLEKHMFSRGSRARSWTAA